MSRQALHEIIGKAVADYGFRLAVMWGEDDVIAGSDLTENEVEALRNVVVPDLKRLSDPVDPDDHPSVQARIEDLPSEVESAGFGNIGSLLPIRVITELLLRFRGGPG